MLVEEVDVPERVFLGRGGQIHLEQHPLVEESIKLPQQLLSLDCGAKPPAEDPTEVGPDY